MDAPKKIYISPLMISLAEILKERVTDDDVEYIRKDKSTRQRLAEWSKTPEGRESYEKVAEEMRKQITEDEELEKEVKKYISKDTPELWTGDDDYEYTSVPLCWMYDFARHFAKWGADHTPLPEDTVLFNKGVEEGKRLMMEEAVDIRVQRSPLNGPLGISAYCCNFPSNHPFYHCKEGDKVRIIIVKED